MDGNGRWAELRGLPRIEGHRRGAERAREAIDTAIETGVRYLTLYAFSVENWQRPVSEVSMLMKLLEVYLQNEFANLMKKDVVYRAIGERERLPLNIQELIRRTEAETAGNRGMTLISALSYGGRGEIMRAFKRMAAAGVTAADADETRLGPFLDTAGIPDPDLIIRTSGERRVSNFLLWQAAYAEFYFTDTLWPDFDREEFMLAIQDFQSRERRFGKIATGSDAS